jgi:hypothetical protein
LVPFATPLAVIALALPLWDAVRVSANESDAVALHGDPKVCVCTVFDMVATMQAHKDLAPANASLELLGGGDNRLCK